MSKSQLPIVQFYWDHKKIRFDDCSIFTDQNDHNPFVAERCPKCLGIGRWFEERVDCHIDYSCDRCKGTGHIDKPVRLFDNERTPIVVHPRPDGWLKCPFCGWTFTIRDKAVWTGRRHRCGQLLIIDDASGPRT